jgi:hypothetical protein
MMSEANEARELLGAGNRLDKTLDNMIHKFGEK